MGLLWKGLEITGLETGCMGLLLATAAPDCVDPLCCGSCCGGSRLGGVAARTWVGIIMGGGGGGCTGWHACMSTVSWLGMVMGRGSGGCTG